MFWAASAFNQDLSRWDTAAVTDMWGMFSGNAGAVTDMGAMFSSASAFNHDLSSWNTAAVTDMWGMFSEASAFNQDLSSWDVMAVTDKGRPGSGSFMWDGAAAMTDEAHKPCTATGVGADGTTPWRKC